MRIFLSFLLSGPLLLSQHFTKHFSTFGGKIPLCESESFKQLVYKGWSN